MHATWSYPGVKYRARGRGAVSSAGTLLLAQTARVVGLDEALRTELAGFMRPLAMHHPGKAVMDLAVTLAAGGDCPADVAMLRSRPHLFGLVASDPTVSRIVDDLAGDVEAAVAGIAAARAHARLVAAGLPGGALPGSAAAGGHRTLVVDLDATLITAHSEKEWAAPTFKRGFGFHPLLGFADHGEGGTGAPLAGLLRPGNAGSNTAADHVSVLDAALAQLPDADQARVLVRADSAGGTKEFLHHVHGQGLRYSVGFAGYLPYLKDALAGVVPSRDWAPAVDGDGTVRPSAWVGELTAVLDLSDWPPGLRVIARAERPHPGAQLSLTDVDGNRVTCFATNDPGTDLPALEARHRQRARCEDRIRNAKDTGLRNLPYADAASNILWLNIVLLAMDLTTWTQQLALTGPWRVAEPKTLRAKLFATAARYLRLGRSRVVDLDPDWPWTRVVHDALQHLTWLARLAPN